MMFLLYQVYYFIIWCFSYTRFLHKLVTWSDGSDHVEWLRQERSDHTRPISSWPSRAWKKNLLAFLSTFWHPCSKCILMCFKKDRGGCQVWKCPKVTELGQRSTECKFLYIRQILAFLSIYYPKLWLKVMQNLFWIIQPCYINKQHHQGMMCVWIQGHLGAKSVIIVAIFYLYRGKIQSLSSLLS